MLKTESGLVDWSSKDFIVEALGCSSRALNLLDRSPFSKTYGCFDRYFWHFKMKDFPSSTYQMGCEYLARIWCLKDEANPHYQDEKILTLCKAAIEYALSIQHRDGSFDEWYPNERGWAGPTSYVCHSLYASYTIIESHIDDESFKKRFHDGLRRAGYFLIKRDEKEVLSNHFALYLLSLAEIIDLTGDTVLEQAYEKSLDQFFDYTSEEGWSLEYDGVDFGYNIATLSFFARLSQLKPDERITNYAKKSFRFLAYFALPNGELGAGMGSRATVHLYPLAFYYWSSQSPEAAQILQHLIKHKSFAKVLPSHQDDHYLFYRLSEYLELATFSENHNQSLESLPCEGVNFNQLLPEAGLFVAKTKDYYLVVNQKLGGAFTVTLSNPGNRVVKNFGWVVVDKKNNQHTSLWNSNSSFSNNDETLCAIKGQARRVFSSHFSPSKLILFRLATLICARFTLGAYYLKLLIRKILIVGQRPSPYSFSRKLRLEDGHLIVVDEIEGLLCGDRLFWGNEFVIRYVPQSRYVRTKTEIPPNQIPLNNQASVQVTESICLKTGIVKQCVQ